MIVGASMKKTVVRLALGTLSVIAIVALSSCSLFGNPTVTLTGTGGGLTDSVSLSPDNFQTSASEVGKVVTVQEVRIVFDSGTNHGPAYNVDIDLISPGGKNVAVFAPYNSDMIGIDFENGGTYTFVDDHDDDGLPRFVDHLGVIVPETYQASGDFDDFEDWDLFGSWTLRFRVVGSDLTSAGTILSWRVIIEYEEEF
jgi:hypothetical protein